MTLPALVYYPTQGEYRNHYNQTYCRGVVTTADGIRVYFKPDQFNHAFFESSARDGSKDVFSAVRAERIDWIKATLEHPDAVLFEGWIKSKREYTATSRVAIVYEDFVTVVRMRLSRDSALRAEFVTSYSADNSITRIRTSPAWSREACLQSLRAVSE